MSCALSEAVFSHFGHQSLRRCGGTARCARETSIAQLSRAASVTHRMPREQARFSLATWRNHEISDSRRAWLSEQSAQTCVEDREDDEQSCKLMMESVRQLKSRFVSLFGR